MACPSTRTRSRDRRHGPPRPTPRAARRRPSQRETRLKMAAFFLGGEGHYPRTPLAGDRRRRGRVARKCAPLHRGRSRGAGCRPLVPQPAAHQTAKMAAQPRVIAMIPARGGSVSIPKKNIKPLAGRPLIDWVIKPAIHSGCFAEVWVSTDDVSGAFEPRVPASADRLAHARLHRCHRPRSPLLPSSVAPRCTGAHLKRRRRLPQPSPRSWTSSERTQTTTYSV